MVAKGKCSCLYKKIEHAVTCVASFRRHEDDLEDHIEDGKQHLVINSSVIFHKGQRKYPVYQRNSWSEEQMKGSKKRVKNFEEEDETSNSNEISESYPTTDEETDDSIDEQVDNESGNFGLGYESEIDSTLTASASFHSNELNAIEGVVIISTHSKENLADSLDYYSNPKSVFEVDTVLQPTNNTKKKTRYLSKNIEMYQDEYDYLNARTRNNFETASNHRYDDCLWYCWSRVLS